MSDFIALWLTWILLTAVVWTVIGAVVGWNVGKGKGRARQGLWLGLLLGWIGILIIAVLPQTDEELQRRARLTAEAAGGLAGAGRWNGQPSAGQVPAVTRQEAVAEALRRDPSLGATDDPATLERLDQAVAQIHRELELKAEVAALKSAEVAAAAAAQREAEQRAWRDEEARRAALRAEEERHHQLAAQREREAAIAAMSPVQRWVVTHQRQVVGGGVAVVVIAAALIAAAAIRGADQQQQSALALACDITQVKAYQSNVAVMNAWLDCPSNQVRLRVLNLAEATLDPARLSSLATDPDEDIRLALARRAGLPVALHEVLAKDPSGDVRRIMATKPDTIASALTLLAADERTEVGLALVKNPNTPMAVIQKLSTSKDPAVSKAALLKLAVASPCEPDTLPQDRIAGTQWKDAIHRYEFTATRMNLGCELRVTRLSSGASTSVPWQQSNGVIMLWGGVNDWDGLDFGLTRKGDRLVGGPNGDLVKAS